MTMSSFEISPDRLTGIRSSPESSAATYFEEGMKTVDSIKQKQRVYLML